MLLTTAGIFIILCGNELGYHLSGGEEQYLAFARQYMDPDWIAGSFTLTEFAGTRLLFQVLVGTLLRYISIADAAFLLRLVSYAGMAIAMGRLLFRLKFKWYWALVITQLFVMSDQSFFAGEWIVLSFEPKVVAYIFVFMALGSAVEKRWLQSALWLGLATWFHFLVGGWMAVCMGLYLIWERRREWPKQFALPYVLLIAPLVIYLYSGYFNSEPVDTIHDLNWVYCYYRLPHHLGLFVSMEDFVKLHAIGVIVSAIVMLAAIVFRRHFTGEMRMFHRMLIIALSINLVFVGVAWADRYLVDHAFAGLLKFYPFRLSGFALYSSMLLAGWVLWERLDGIGHAGRRVRMAVAVLVGLLGVVQVINHIKDELEPQYTSEYLDVTANIRSEVPEDAVFALINQPLDSDAYSAFIRLTGRENFSVKKFVPGEKHKLNEWYNRQLDLMQVNEDNGALRLLKSRYHVTHVLSPVELEGYRLVYSNEPWFVYEIQGL